MDYYSNELYHHGIKGQKWGVRRFQYSDGTLTPQGRKRYGGNTSEMEKRVENILGNQLSIWLIP